MAVLKLRQDDERAQAQFELDYLTSLTTRERFDLMLRIGATAFPVHGDVQQRP